MSSERDLIRDSLAPDEAGWDEFESRFLGKVNECPSLGKLIAMVAKSKADAQELPIPHDVVNCPRCGPLLEIFQKANTTVPENPREAARAGSLLADVVGSLSETDYPFDDQTDPRTSEIWGLLRDGKIQQALKRLHGLLAGVLQEYGSDPTQVGSFREFLAEQLRQDPSADQRFHELTLAFVRKSGAKEPAESRWPAVIFRGAIRGIQRRIEPTDPKHRFLQFALEERVESEQGVRKLYLDNDVWGDSLEREDLNFLCTKIEKATSSFASVFRLN